MPRSVKKPEIRRQELIDIAQKQFIARGYEKTSIRSIVGEAEGEIGMFYHYFASKEEIFTAVLEQYNAAFVDRLKLVASRSGELSILELLNAILLDLGQVLNEYANIQPEKADTQMLTILHHNALLAIKPIFCDILEPYIQKREIHPPDVNTTILADFLLFGMSAILHDPQIDNMNDKLRGIRVLYGQVLGFELGDAE